MFGLSSGGRREPALSPNTRSRFAPERDRVVAGAADDDVVAATPVVIVSLPPRLSAVERPDAVDVVRVVVRVAASRVAVGAGRDVVDQVVDEAVVAEDDVVVVGVGGGLAVVGDDRVVAGAAEDLVAADAGRDPVVAAVLAPAAAEIDSTSASTGIW